MITIRSIAGPEVKCLQDRCLRYDCLWIAAVSVAKTPRQLPSSLLILFLPLLILLFLFLLLSFSASHSSSHSPTHTTGMALNNPTIFFVARASSARNLEENSNICDVLKFLNARPLMVAPRVVSRRILCSLLPLVSSPLRLKGLPYIDPIKQARDLVFVLSGWGGLDGIPVAV